MHSPGFTDGVSETNGQGQRSMTIHIAYFASYKLVANYLIHH